MTPIHGSLKECFIDLRVCVWAMMISGNECVAWLQVVHVCTSCAARGGAQPFLQTGLNSGQSLTSVHCMSLLIMVQAPGGFPSSRHHLSAKEGREGLVVSTLASTHLPALSR